MDLLSNHMSTKVFCDTISNSEFQQRIHKKNPPKLFPTMVDLLFTHYDHHYSMVESKDKILYMKQRLIELGSLVEDNPSEYYDKFKYNNKMNVSTIQHGLQGIEYVSTLLYLSDLYKLGTIVYLESKGEKIIISDKNYTPFHLIYTSKGKWYTVDAVSKTLEDYNETDFNQLSNCLNLNISTKNVYKKFLGGISTYKLPELVSLATQRNIPLMKDGKKKIKKVLYDDINLYELNN